jgi:1,4-alpha-glucan branching enzyme
MVKVNDSNHHTNFQISLSEAKSVAVLGDFNEWHRSAHPMKKQENGDWKLEVELPEGEHQFRYFVNENHWQNDPDCPVAANVFGTENSTVNVKF